MNLLLADKHQIVKYNTNVEKALKLKEKLKDIISLYQSRARIGVIKNRTF